MKLINQYSLNKTIIQYYQNPTGDCEWSVIPREKLAKLNLPQRLKFDSLVQAKLVGDDFPKGFVTGSTMRNAQTVKDLRYVKQATNENREQLIIVTTLADQQNNLYHHHVISDKQSSVIETYVVFENQSGQNQTIEMLSSVSLSNLSPFNAENQPGNLVITRYRSKWSFEGRKEQNPLEEYQLEPSWNPWRRRRMTKKRTDYQWLGLAFVLWAMAFLLFTIDLTAFADVQTTLKDIETGAGTQFKAIANIGIGIIIILFGGAQFLGAEIKSWAQKFLIGAIVGAIVIVNFDWIRDTFWGWIGG